MTVQDSNPFDFTNYQETKPVEFYEGAQEGVIGADGTVHEVGGTPDEAQEEFKGKKKAKLQAEIDELQGRSDRIRRFISGEEEVAPEDFLKLIGGEGTPLGHPLDPRSWPERFGSVRGGVERGLAGAAAVIPQAVRVGLDLEVDFIGWVMDAPEVADVYKDHVIGGVANRMSEAIRDMGDNNLATNPRARDAWLGGKGAEVIAGTTPLMLATAAYPPAGLMLGAISQAGAQYEEARAAGASDTRAYASAIGGGAIGTVDALGAGAIFSRVGRKLGGSAMGRIVQGLGRATEGAVVEGVTEGVQEGLSNVVAQLYDDERLYLANVFQAAEGGSFAGVFFAALGMSANGAARRQRLKALREHRSLRRLPTQDSRVRDLGSSQQGETSTDPRYAERLPEWEDMPITPGGETEGGESGAQEETTPVPESIEEPVTAWTAARDTAQQFLDSTETEGRVIDKPETPFQEELRDYVINNGREVALVDAPTMQRDSAYVNGTVVINVNAGPDAIVRGLLYHEVFHGLPMEVQQRAIAGLEDVAPNLMEYARNVIKQEDADLAEEEGTDPQERTPAQMQEEAASRTTQELVTVLEAMHKNPDLLVELQAVAPSFFRGLMRMVKDGLARWGIGRTSESAMQKWLAKHGQTETEVEAAADPESAQSLFEGAEILFKALEAGRVELRAKVEPKVETKPKAKPKPKAVAEAPKEEALFGEQEKAPAARKEGAPVRVTQPNLLDINKDDLAGQGSLLAEMEKPKVEPNNKKALEEAIEAAVQAQDELMGATDPAEVARLKKDVARLKRRVKTIRAAIKANKSAAKPKGGVPKLLSDARDGDMGMQSFIRANGGLAFTEDLRGLYEDNDLNSPRPGFSRLVQHPDSGKGMSIDDAIEGAFAAGLIPGYETSGEVYPSDFMELVESDFGAELSAPDVQEDYDEFIGPPQYVEPQDTGFPWEMKFASGKPTLASAAFKKWFGDSKVVDAEGKPLVVYHDTDADFTQFQRGAESEFDYGAAGESGGFFFYTDPSGSQARSEHTLPVYLAIENPVIIDPAETRGLEGQAKRLQEAEAAGHDGARIGGQWVAFSPAQIKSATGNKGTFDASNPDIKFASGKPTLFSGQAIKQTDAILDKWMGDTDRENELADIRAHRHEANLVSILQKSGKLPAKWKARTRHQAVQQLNDAIFLNIDLRGIEKAEYAKFEAKLEPWQKELYERSQNLSKEEQFVADQIRDENYAIGGKAIHAGVIKAAKENYVARMWKDDSETKGKRSKFSPRTARSKHRSLSSVLHGWSLGKELEISGAIEAQNMAVKQVHQAQYDKMLIHVLKKHGLLSDKSEGKGWELVKNGNFTSPFWAGTLGTTGKASKQEFFGEPGGKLPGKEGKAHGRRFFGTEDGTLIERRALYAPEDLAAKLNNVLGTSRLYKIFGFKTLTKLNALVKATVLFTSLFHHQAFIRSYVFSIPFQKGKLGQHNPITGYKAGRKAINEENPLLVEGFEQGLTIGKAQDFDPIARADWASFSKVGEKVGATRAVLESAKAIFQAQSNFLFNHLGANLKAQAYMLEAQHLLHQNRAKIESGAMTREYYIKVAAGVTNADFGGLNLRREFRNPELQHLFRLAFLAPDWTESNVRSMLNAVRLDEKGKIYRRLWYRTAMKAGLATVAFNYLMAGFDDEEFQRRYKAAWDEGNLRWMEADLTGMAPGSAEGSTKYFNVLGHFRDPIKFVTHTARSAKHKGSIFSTTVFNFLTGSDWAGRRYTTAMEAIGLDDKGEYQTSRKGKYKKGDPKGGRLAGQTVTWDFAGGGDLTFDQYPSFMVERLRSMTPIQVQNLLGFLTGEMDGFDAVTKSMGLMTSTTRPKQDQ